MSNEFNDLSLRNADGILQQDEWNSKVYEVYRMEELKEYSSGDFVESVRFPEFNDARGQAFTGEKKKDDHSQEGVQQAALTSAVSSVVSTFVGLCVGALIITGSYTAVTAKDAGNTTAVGFSDVRWEWSADHTSADAVLVTDEGETKIPADVDIEEKAYCTTEGEVIFHAKAPAGDGKNYYGTYNETIPPKGHDFQVQSSGKYGDGKVYADYVCKTCGEHFTVNAEISSEEGEPGQ